MICIRSLGIQEGHRIPKRQMLALETLTGTVPNDVFDRLMVAILQSRPAAKPQPAKE